MSRVVHSSVTRLVLLEQGIRLSGSERRIIDSCLNRNMISQARNEIYTGLEMILNRDW
jgi:hypothetical protein